MKQYLLNEDQIERMLAVAIEYGADSDSMEKLLSKPIDQRIKTPEKRAHKNAIILWDQLKQIEIILPIETN